MNGLEAIELMKQGKMVIRTSTQILYRLQDGVLEGCDHAGTWESNLLFDLNDDYEECIESKSLTGWERVVEGSVYRVSHADGIEIKVERGVFSECDYKNANYFSTKEKAEEIKFKQTLFRKLQRFSDENGGNEIVRGKKASTIFLSATGGLEALDVWSNRIFGNVVFASEEVAEKAIELFRDDLIKYFTHDWSGKNETSINVNSEER